MSPTDRTDYRKPLHRRRPAETTTAGVGILIALVALVTGEELDPDTAAVLLAALAALPAIITRIVERVRGHRLGD